MAGRRRRSRDHLATHGVQSPAELDVLVVGEQLGVEAAGAGLDPLDPRRDQPGLVAVGLLDPITQSSSFATTKVTARE